VRVILSLRRRVRPGIVLALVLALLLVRPGQPYAHDVPASVSLLAFVRPEGHALRIVLRAPLEAMRDVNFPVHGPGYLDLDRARPLLRDAVRVWIADALQLYENGAELPAPRIVATRVSLPSERSFVSYDSALAHTTGPPLPYETEIMWKQAMLDVVLEYPIAVATSRFSVRPSLARLGVRTTTVLRFSPPSGTERAFEYTGDPGLVRLDPSWYQAARSFVALGVAHIIGGLDHLLFLLCLVVPFRRIRPLVAIVTSFTVAHSITLLASAAGMAPDALWFPPLIEVLIALSIVWMALENIVGAKLERRWILAFGFGLIHGFGFSFALRESLQFAGVHLATSLLAFNVGVELGQLMVIALAVPALGWLFTRVVPERPGTIILSAFVAHGAWHWLLERGATLRQYRVELPALDVALAVSVLRGLMVLVFVVGCGWATYILARRLGATPALEPEHTPRGASE
jgi:HupE/UreJ protein